jgi:NitT/TauT family transport system substrate-binding protein
MRKLSLLGTLLVAALAIAQDKVKVGVFPVSSSLPFFVAHGDTTIMSAPGPANVTMTLPERADVTQYLQRF